MHHGLTRTSSIVLMLMVGTAACASPAAPSPPPSDSPLPSTVPTATVPATVASPLPSATPAALNSPTPTDQPPPTGVMALYGAGTGGELQLFALSEDGAADSLGLEIYPRAAVSRDGQWLATPGEQLPADAVVVTNRVNGTTHTITVTSNFDPYGMAFDANVTRLAFLELGAPEAEGTPWALVVVDLEDGSATRFPATTNADGSLLPGVPIGWSSDDLLINTFMPFTEAGSAGLRRISLPPNVAPMPVGALDRGSILTAERYLFEPRLSPENARLLFLNRDDDYTPDDYRPVGYDLAVNQLGVLDLTSNEATLWVEEADGGALGNAAAWSPDGELALFAEGRYDGDTFASLTLKTVDDAGTVSRVAEMPLPSDGYLVSLDWCVENRVLAVVATNDGVHELHTIDVISGESSLLVSDAYIELIGCVRGAETDEAGNADVVRVRAVQTGGAAPGEGQTTWTFHVTVEHPDTGWEDYADGWDVVTPGGSVLKPDPESAFTRTLLHPHVEEQPFTRSQRDIVVPEGVTRVRVRAHDIVDGFGGTEVMVDLTMSSGENFEVER